MTSRRRGMIGCFAAALLWNAPAAKTQQDPGADWRIVPLTQSGWSGQQLQRAWDTARQTGSTAVVVVQHGALVAAWGEIDSNILLNSVRKSLLSGLIGIAARAGQVHLDDTLATLGIDEPQSPLTPDEKQATVRDLLKARSGVYHRANYETASMAAKRPQRGSHPAGSFWFYNNWDFNTLGAIYERATSRSVFDAFAKQIAAPIGMQDFDPARCHYERGSNSQSPAYLFFASARDLARFGLLYLQKGRWGGRQIIDAAWIDESTRSYSSTGAQTGYGYLWWTMAPEGQSKVKAPSGTFWAEGNGGQILFVVPAYDIVVVHLARTGDEPRIKIAAALRLIEQVLAARPGS